MPTFETLYSSNGHVASCVVQPSGECSGEGRGKRGGGEGEGSREGEREEGRRGRRGEKEFQGTCFSVEGNSNDMGFSVFCLRFYSSVFLRRYSYSPFSYFLYFFSFLLGFSFVLFVFFLSSVYFFGCCQFFDFV